MSDAMDVEKYRAYQRARALIEESGMIVISKKEYDSLAAELIEAREEIASLKGLIFELQQGGDL